MLDWGEKSLLLQLWDIPQLSGLVEWVTTVTVGDPHRPRIGENGENEIAIREVSMPDRTVCQFPPALDPATEISPGVGISRL